MVKNPPANADRPQRHGFDPGSGRYSGGGHGNSLRYSCLENHGQSLVSLGPLGPKELDMTEVNSHIRAHICVSL